MKKSDVQKLIELVNQAVDDQEKMTFVEKRDAILAECDEGDRMNLEEFSSWFDAP